MSTKNKDFDLQAYLTKGVEQVVTDAIKATLKDPKESSFMLRFAAASPVPSHRIRTSTCGTARCGKP